MHLRHFAALALAVSTLTGASAAEPGDAAAQEKVSGEAATAPYRHVVLFKFKDDAPAEDVKAVEDAFVALADKIDLIKDFEWGRNVSPEGLDGGFTHVYFVTFEDKEALEAYLPHPEHKKFVSLLGDVIDKVTVVDYVARES